MASKDLVNLGIAPDSGTGDSARRGGEKINFLFADIYANFGDNPVGADPSGLYYGYRQPFLEHQYKVGELHATGKYSTVHFTTPGKYQDLITPVDTVDGNGDVTGRSPNGFGLDAAGLWRVVSDQGAQTDAGIPGIYRDSEWYFLSRGEQVTLDLSDVPDSAATAVDDTLNNEVHIVLPLARAGDVIRVRDSFDTWGGKVINVWTTPFDFMTQAQLDEWIANTPGVSAAPDSDAHSITQPDGQTLACNYRASLDDSVNSVTWDPAVTETVDGNSAAKSYAYVSNVRFSGQRNVEFEFTYQGPNKGWVYKRRAIASVADDLEVMQDFFTTSDWIEWTADSLGGTTVDGEADVEINKGDFILLVAPGTTEENVDLTTSTTPIVRVHRKMRYTNDVTNGQSVTKSIVLDQIHDFLTAASDDDTLNDNQKKRLSVVGGYTAGAEDVLYTGFKDTDPDNIYKEVVVSKIVDDLGNIMLISSERFDGFVQILIPSN